MDMRNVKNIDEKIPTNIHFVWIGDIIPDYVYFSMTHYKKINPEFNICLFYRTINQIKKIKSGNLIFDDDHIVINSLDRIQRNDNND
jgi:mannosyltransferase OCH1-like enzyme